MRLRQTHPSRVRALGWLFAATFPCAALAQSDSLLQRAVQEEYLAASALVAGAPGGRVPLSAIHIERATDSSSVFQVWRAYLPTSHSRPFLLAFEGGRVVRLGGFSTMELTAVPLQRDKGRTALENARQFARVLARLADANGGLGVVFANGGDDTTETAGKALADWNRQRPRDWPADSAYIAEGRIVVRLTVLSRNLRSYALEWTPIVYSFVFDEADGVSSWGSRRETPFVVRE